MVDLVKATDVAKVLKGWDRSEELVVYMADKSVKVRVEGGQFKAEVHSCVGIDYETRSDLIEEIEHWMVEQFINEMDDR